MPTEACHFRCTYCYQDFHLGRMPPAIIRGLKTWLDRRAPGLDLLQLSWFGGEPLLATDLLEEVQGHALDLARKYPPLLVQAHLTTNGHRLEPDLFRRLLSLRVTAYQITLDGPAAAHDRTRVLAGGGGTFESIWSNLLAMHRVEADFSVQVRVHLHRDNLDEIPALLRRCSEAWGGDLRFRLAFKALFHPGRADYEGRSLLTPAQEAEAVRDLYEQAVSLGLATPSGEGAGAEKDDICYAAKANSFVVRSDGALNKCSVGLSMPENQVGRLNEDGTVAIDPEQMQYWTRGLFSGDAEERHCPMIRRTEVAAAAEP